MKASGDEKSCHIGESANERRMPACAQSISSSMLLLFVPKEQTMMRLDLPRMLCAEYFCGVWHALLERSEWRRHNVRSQHIRFQCQGTTKT